MLCPDRGSDTHGDPIDGTTLTPEPAHADAQLANTFVAGLHLHAIKAPLCTATGALESMR